MPKRPSASSGRSAVFHESYDSSPLLLISWRGLFFFLKKLSRRICFNSLLPYSDKFTASFILRFFSHRQNSADAHSFSEMIQQCHGSIIYNSFIFNGLVMNTNYFWFTNDKKCCVIVSRDLIGRNANYTTGKKITGKIALNWDS